MSSRACSIAAAAVSGLSLFSAAMPARAQALEMTVQQFLAIGADIPRNRAVAVMRPDTRRLIREVAHAVNTVKAEQAAALAAGRRPAHCIPASGTGITPEALVARFETLPEARRRLTVTQAVREWMIERHPCRA